MFNVGDPTSKVPNRDTFIVSLELLVEFTSGNEFPPLEDVVEKKLVTSVKDFRDQKNRWLHIHPVSPEWQMDPVEQESFCQFLKMVQIPWVNLLGNIVNLHKCELASVRGMAMSITKSL